MSATSCHLEKASQMEVLYLEQIRDLFQLVVHGIRRNKEAGMSQINIAQTLAKIEHQQLTTINPEG